MFDLMINNTRKEKDTCSDFKFFIVFMQVNCSAPNLQVGSYYIMPK